jgi:hypothetical protein
MTDLHLRYHLEAFKKRSFSFSCFYERGQAACKGRVCEYCDAM